MPILKPGDHVWYVPDLCYWLEQDRQGNWLFEFVHHADGPPVSLQHKAMGKQQAKVGQAVVPSLHIPDPEGRAQDQSEHGIPLRREDGKDGCPILHTFNGYALKAVRSARRLAAVVREEVERVPRHIRAVVEGKEQDVTVYDETRRLMLDIPLPKGFVTIHSPLEGAATVVAYDPTGHAHHSYHLDSDPSRFGAHAAQEAA